MVDYEHDGKVFDFDDVFYAEDIKKQDWEIRFDIDKIDKQIMIIIDIFGNKKREVKKRKDFGGRNGKRRIDGDNQKGRGFFYRI